ncbi:MAG: DUF971 domain-containing protein [Armatimonadetes bacterium]|nr:DUF971 domain-containing protein [Armatimonadota bacterium]
MPTDEPRSPNVTPDAQASAPTRHAGPAAPGAAPLDLHVHLAGQRLRIRWQDGTESQLPLALLRRHCPCAACRTDRQAQSATALPVLKTDPSADIRVTAAQLVGRYAIQFTWSDGHDTGIFDFHLLRSLCGR